MSDNKSLPLVVRKNLRDNEANLQKNLGKIGSSVGGTWTFEFDPSPEAIIKAVQGEQGTAPDDLGTKIYENLLSHVATMFETAAKDEMTKEALVEALPNKKIKYRGGVASTDWGKLYKIEDGNLILELSGYHYGGYDSYFSEFKIEKLL